MTAPGGPPHDDPSLEHLLEASLRPGADRDPALSATQLGEGARRRAGQIRRRRSAGVTALGTGALVALTLVAFPALRGLASPDPRTVLPPAGPASVEASPTGDPSPAPSAGASSAPSSPPSGPSSVTGPLALTPEGYLLVPDEVEPLEEALPDGVDPAVGDATTPAGAFLQNVVPACAEADDEGSTSTLGEDLRGARTWTHAGLAADGMASYAEARVDLFVPGGAVAALQSLVDRAAACEDAGLGTTATTAGGEEQPGADGYLLVTGTVPGVEGTPEVAVPAQASALVVVRVGDVLVRSLVSVSGDGVTEVGPKQVGRAQELARAYVATLGTSGTAQRLAVTP